MTKQAVIELHITMLTEVPEDWDANLINFKFQDSSHCLFTEIDQLTEEEPRAEDGCCFTRHRAKGFYLRDATPEDIKTLTPPNPPPQHPIN